MINTVFELEKGAMEPRKSHASDAGYDLFTLKRVMLLPNNLTLLDTGVHIMIPEGHVGLVLPRSSIAKDSILIHTGVIDSGYTGTVNIIAQNLSNKNYLFRSHSRAAQLVILPIANVRLVQGQVSSQVTDRGMNGFGSTGK